MRRLNVAFYGPVGCTSGFGTAARAYAHALHGAGINLSIIDPTHSSPTVTNPILASLLYKDIRPDFHLFYFNEPRAVLPLFPYRDRVIFVTTWEAESLPDGWSALLNNFREIWVPSTYNLSVFSKYLTTPVFRWPHGIEPGPSSNQEADVSVLPLLQADDFVFYSILTWQQRKNPEGILEAFMRAFPEKNKAILILKVAGGGEDILGTLQRLRARTHSDARIVIVDKRLTDSQLEALTRRGECYISLHKGEGWCYPLFDAACRGKWIISTSYSGPMDYLDANAHHMVRCTLAPVGQTDRWYNTTMSWAEPDVDHAVELIRMVYEQREIIPERSKAAADRIKTAYSSDAIGAIARDRLMSLS